MHELLLHRTRTVLLFVLALAAASALAFAIAAGGTGAVAQAKQPHAAQHARQHAKQTARHHAKQQTGVSDPAGGATDPDNVQSGDQSTPDASGETSGENESSVESEQGQPGEPANGHQDASGANHECTGNCVE